LFLITINREVKAFILIGTLQGFWLYKRFIVRQFVGLTGNIRPKKKWEVTWFITKKLLTFLSHFMCDT